MVFLVSLVSALTVVSAAMLLALLMLALPSSLLSPITQIVLGLLVNQSNHSVGWRSFVFSVGQFARSRPVYSLGLLCTVAINQIARSV